MPLAVVLSSRALTRSPALPRRRHEMIYRISPVFDIATCDRVVQLAEVIVLLTVRLDFGGCVGENFNG